MSRRAKILVAIFVATLCTAARVSAQRAAEASVARDPAKSAELAQRSLDLLKLAEEGDPPSKAECYTQGLGFARQAVALDDRNADAHFAVFATMGRLMLEHGATPNPFNLLKINRELDRTLELNPRHSDALASKGGLARQLPTLLGGSLSKAERYLQQSIEIDPTAVGARIELARVYQDMGQEPKAVSLLRTAVELAEQQGRTRKRAEAEQLLGQLQQ
ncbi:MAG TPA: tetratricopeptide repeat protein [Candidatus Binatia bacterium]|nr:tetratricopeptide repeat protein [Candidatus Binatia bacterium]